MHSLSVYGSLRLAISLRQLLAWRHMCERVILWELVESRRDQLWPIVRPEDIGYSVSSEYGLWCAYRFTFWDANSTDISMKCRDVDLEGVRDNASAVVCSLPGTWEIMKSNRKRRIRNRWILGGISSRAFVPRGGTIGLWSVSMWNVLPIK